MLQRSNQIELEDNPSLTDKRLFESSFRYFQNTNRWLGNYWLIKNYLKKILSDKKTVSIIDIGTGTGDLPRFLTDWFRRIGVVAAITGIDNNADVISLAKNLSSRYPNIKFECTKNFIDSTIPYNVAILSQVLHHFTPNEASEYLKKVYSNITDGIIISDLIRSRVAYWLVKIVVFLTTTNPISRNDGPISVLRCYNDEEIRKILEDAHISNYEIQNYFPRKIILIKKS